MMKKLTEGAGLLGESLWIDTGKIVAMKRDDNRGMTAVILVGPATVTVKETPEQILGRVEAE